MNVLGGTQRWRAAVVAALAAAASLPGPIACAQEAAAPPLPVVGETIQPFDAEGVDGTMKKIAFEGKGSTVLLFFLPSCPVCHRMIPEWNRAFQRKPAGLQVVGVIMDRETPGFFQSFPMSFPVVRAPSREFLKRLKISRAPLMVRVAHGGRVEDVVMGLTDPIRVGEVFRP
jgi:hypothetical protein